MQKILILDFGSRHPLMLARKVRQCHVYCEVLPAAGVTAAQVRQIAPVGIILTGDSCSVCQPEHPLLDGDIFSLGIPMLGIGYGCELMAVQLGGEVAPAPRPQAFARTLAMLDPACTLWLDFIPENVVWMRRTDVIRALPAGFRATAQTLACPIIAFEDRQRQLYGLQFHPEYPNTEGGIRMLRAFLYGICQAEESWNMENYATVLVDWLRSHIGSRKVLLALSGGVDSSVVAALLDRAVGRQLTCIFVDTGMLRLGEADKVEDVFGKLDMNFIRINAKERFFARLKGITDQVEKRRIIGEEFSHIFHEEAAKLGHVEIFAQGSIYTDISQEDGPASRRKFQNAGGLPVDIDFDEVLEPLRNLFKEEVRDLGRALGLLEQWVTLQPFPGPGMAVRIIGEVTREKVELLQQADLLFRRELEKARMQDQLGQYFAVLTDSPSVSIADGQRVYGYTLALRAVSTDDYRTATWARLPYELLDSISQTLTSRFPQISRIVYDITSKPPAAIEWE